MWQVRGHLTSPFARKPLASIQIPLTSQNPHHIYSFHLQNHSSLFLIHFLKRDSLLLYTNPSFKKSLFHLLLQLQGSIKGFIKELHLQPQHQVQPPPLQASTPSNPSFNHSRIEAINTSIGSSPKLSHSMVPILMGNADAGRGGGGGRRRRRWEWLLGALIVAILAFAATTGSYQNAPFFGIISKKSTVCPLGSRKYTGIVEDCTCDYETVDSLNEEVLNPILQELVTTPFFRYFKVKLWCDCPFWPDDGMCRLRDCSVCECPENEFPEPFRKPLQALPADDLKCQEGKREATVDRTLDSKAFRGWIEVDNPWTYDDETDNAEMTYVNLQLNPERYTGYVGPSARRTWDAIYTENCPKYPSGEFCPEKRVLYKLISGLHSSISVHIASDYLLDEAKNLWDPNPELLYERVLQYPERVRNLYFTFLFVLRAVTKAADYLEQAEYSTGNPEDDLKTQSLVRQLVHDAKLQAACPLPFDEAKLWQGESGPELKQEIQKQFRNISALMDCVGCEKCRLWGKLQVLGLGTALKILFSVNGHRWTNQPVQLQRNEVIALVNLLNRLSESVDFVRKMAPQIDKLMAAGQGSSPASRSVSQ